MGPDPAPPEPGACREPGNGASRDGASQESVSRDSVSGGRGRPATPASSFPRKRESRCSGTVRPCGRGRPAHWKRVREPGNGASCRTRASRPLYHVAGLRRRTSGPHLRAGRFARARPRSQDTPLIQCPKDPRLRRVAGETPALPGHMDSRLRGNDGSEGAGAIRAVETPVSPQDTPFPGLRRHGFNSRSANKSSSLC